MSNPEALAAISQIQTGLQRLQAAAPELYSTMGMPNLAAGMNFGRSATGSNSTSNTTSTTTTTSSASSNTSSSTPAQGQNMDSFRQLMNSMVTGMANQGLNANVPPPEERFQTQLETLASMGFVDRQANIQGKSYLHYIESSLVLTKPLKFEANNILVFYSPHCYLRRCKCCDRQTVEFKISSRWSIKLKLSLQ